MIAAAGRAIGIVQRLGASPGPPSGGTDRDVTLAVRVIIAKLRIKP